MNMRFSLILLIIGSWVAVGAVWFIDSDFGSEESEAQSPFFYNVPVADLVEIKIETEEGQTIGFHYRENENRWYFDETSEYINVPTDPFRWGGITTLLGGPRTQRVLQDEIENPAQYGLDSPTSRYTFTLRNGAVRTVLIGNFTPDRGNTYAKMEDLNSLVLIDSTWAGVLDRLATDPPVPEWMYELNPDEVREVLLFENNDVIRAYGIDRSTGEFHLCTLPVQDDPCTGDTPVDEEAFRSAIEHIADRHVEGVVDLNLQSAEEFVPYGAGRNSPYFAIRVERRPEGSSVTEVHRVTMTIGDVTPDGEARYAVANETSDIIRVDKEWADRVLELFHGEPLVAEASS